MSYITNKICYTHGKTTYMSRVVAILKSLLEKFLMFVFFLLTAHHLMKDL